MVQKIFAFSISEKVAECRMRGFDKLTNFPAFSVHKTPSPTAFNGPSSPSWARVFRSVLVDGDLQTGEGFLDSMIFGNRKQKSPESHKEIQGLWS